MSRELTAKSVWDEYASGKSFKAGLGSLGLYEQNRRNERFFVGDQWHGAKTGGERPLVRHNVIKRIGDYKMSVIGSNPLTVQYSAEGVPNTMDLIQTQVEEARRQVIAQQGMLDDHAIGDDDVSINLVMSALSEYFETTAERVKLEDKKSRIMLDAYTGGTSYLYTYWDPAVKTGLYADEDRKTAIRGDISVEVLDVENVYLGDPNSDDLQGQPYILIAQRKSVGHIRKLAKKSGASEAEIEAIQPDLTEIGYMAGDRSQEEPSESKKTTLLTRLWKETDDDGNVTVKGMQCCQNVIVRKEWDLKIRLYPLAGFQWDRRKNCGYGDSEITYLIPNQIAINRMITANVWAVMMLGVPITVVNGDVVQQPITNDPGQVLRVFGTAEDVNSAIRYVNPPNFSPRFYESINGLISNTLTQSGANDAALGDMRPENTSAIIAVREAATMPMQLTQNRFYEFIADVARIWAEFWVMKYGKRALKITDENGTWYMPFDGERYKELILSVKIDVGASTLWGESQTVATLDSLLSAGVIDPVQYLTRLPNGVIPSRGKLIEEVRQRMAAQSQTAMPNNPTEPVEEADTMDVTEVLEGLPPKYQQQLASMDQETASAVINRAIGSNALQ